MDVSGERLKTRGKTLFSFFKLLANFDENFHSWDANMPVLSSRLFAKSSGIHSEDNDCSSSKKIAKWAVSLIFSIKI